MRVFNVKVQPQSQLEAFSLEVESINKSGHMMGDSLQTLCQIGLQPLINLLAVTRTQVSVHHGGSLGIFLWHTDALSGLATSDWKPWIPFADLSCCFAGKAFTRRRRAQLRSFAHLIRRLTLTGVHAPPSQSA